MTAAYTIPVFAKLLLAAGFGAGYWVSIKLVDSDKTLSPKQKDTAKVSTLGFMGALMLLQYAFGGL